MKVNKLWFIFLVLSSISCKSTSIDLDSNINKTETPDAEAATESDEDSQTESESDAELELELELEVEPDSELVSEAEIITPQRGLSGATGCTNNSDPEFTTEFMAHEDISFILPVGTIVTNGFIKSHSYVYSTEDVSATRGFTRSPIYSPINGRITRVKSFVFTDQYGDEFTEYSIDIEVSCEVFIMFDHLDGLNPDFLTLLDPDMKEASGILKNPLQINAGTLVGYSGANKFDFGTYHSERQAPYLKPDRVPFEKDIYGVCPYDFFDEDSKNIYLSKLSTLDRESAYEGPVACGSPSRDQENSILGQWFLDETSIKIDSNSATNMLSIVQGSDNSIWVSASRYQDQSPFFNSYDSIENLSQLSVGQSICLEGRSNDVVEISLLESESLEFTKGTGDCDSFSATSTSTWIR